MDTKQAIISFIDILLRVPSLFVLDEVFQSCLSDLGLYPCTLLPLHKEADFDNVTGEANHTLLKPHHSVANYDSAIFGNLSENLVNVIEYGMYSPFSVVIDDVINYGICGAIIQIILLLSGIFFIK